MGRIGRPAEIAAAIAFLASSEAAMVTGVALSVDAGVTAATGLTRAPEAFSEGGRDDRVGAAR